MLISSQARFSGLLLTLKSTLPAQPSFTSQAAQPVLQGSIQFTHFKLSTLTQ
jgi:hypothetical protein